MKETFKKFLERQKDKDITMKDIGRKGFYIFRRQAITFVAQYNLKEKYLTVERLKLIAVEGKITHQNYKIGSEEYRFCYYIVGKNGLMKGKWTWGQFSPMIPRRDLNKLLNQAKKEKTII